MSASAPSSDRVALEVFTNNPATEIFVIDGHFKRVCTARGTLSAEMDSGIYSIKLRAGLTTQEEDVLLYGPKVEKHYTVAFPSATPLTGTTWTDERHSAAAREQSRKVHERVGEGSSIFLFARDWLDPSRPAEEMANQVLHAAKGLRLADVEGRVLLDYEAKSECMSGRNPWAACNVEVDPGSYLLTLEMADGSFVERTIVATRGWQTQIFLLQEEYGKREKERLPYVPGGSVHLAREYFEPDDQSYHLIELVQHGMANKRQVLPLKLVREIAHGDFTSPLLGLYAAHIFLERRQRLQMLRPVVARLRGLLGLEHPDVEALALLLDEKSSIFIFDAPPTLRRSWPLVLRSTVERPEVVPADSLMSKVAYQICGEEPWLIWRSPVESLQALTTEDLLAESQKAVAELIKVALSFYFESSVKQVVEATSLNEAFKTFQSIKNSAKALFNVAVDAIPAIARQIRTIAPTLIESSTEPHQIEAEQKLELIKAGDDKTEPSPPAQEIQLKAEDIRRLVDALGIPRANLEVLLKRNSPPESNSQMTVKT